MLKGSGSRQWDGTPLMSVKRWRFEWDPWTAPCFSKGDPSGPSGQVSGSRKEWFFILLDAGTGEELARAGVTLTDDFCPFALTEILKPGGQITLLADDFLATNSSLDPASVDFNGWVDLDSDSPAISGVFLTFDGELNRIDGGPISPETLDVVVLPEVRIDDGFTTYIDVVNPNNEGLEIIFDLFDSTGNFVTTSIQNVVPGRPRTVFSL